MPRLHGRIPKYRRHKDSGQPLVTLDGRDHYLGPHGTDASRAEYDRLVTLWLAHGRRGPAAPSAATATAPVSTASADPAVAAGPAVSVNHVILGFWEHAKVHYRKPDGSPTSELDNVRQALRPLRKLYGPTPAADFGPKALREHMVALGWCRTNMNNQVARVKMAFRWAVENELVPPAVHHGLLAVHGLQRGRTGARESEPVRPVPEDRVQAVKPFVSRQVWALVRLQLLTGARAGELVRLRGVDLNTGGEIWVAEPPDHKTAHHGHAKRIYFGPQAQSVLRAFLDDRPVGAFLFRPADAEAERLAALHARRRTPPCYGNRPGTNRRADPRRKPGDCGYAVGTYRQAIWRACDRAFPPPGDLARRRVGGGRGTRWEAVAEWKARLGAEEWARLEAWRSAHRWHPHQLRHNAATHIRREFGIEVARVILGHRSASVTEIYAELDEGKARDTMRRIG